MKSILTAIFLIFCQLLFANPEIITVRTDEKVLKGYVNEKYPFTMYLRYFDHSCCHLSTYSVYGWYQYDEYKKKIPLVGFNFGQELYLYNFKDKEKDSLVLYFDADGNFWDQIDYLKNLQGYNEKIVFKEEEGMNVAHWSNTTSTLPLDFYPNNYSVYETKEFLILDENKSFDLDNLPVWMRGFELISNTPDKQRFLLSFNYGSRMYVMGMCGAGIEAGYLVLTFDESLHFSDYEIYYTESCMDNYYTNHTEKSTHGFRHTVWSGEVDGEFDLIVDTKNCIVTKVNSN